MSSHLVRGGRRRLGLSQEDLSARAGVSVRGIRNIELGRVTRPRPSTVRLLADALELSGPTRVEFHERAAPEPCLLPGDRPAVSHQLPAAVPRPAPIPVPRQLPAPPPHFVGRTSYVRRLDPLLAAETSGDATGLWTIVGPAGVGKTAVAVHWAQRVLDRFSDGQLYLDLRGNGPDALLDTDTALCRLLSALGMPTGEQPPDRQGRTALLRTHLANRRMLILLDNARHSEQVRPLLPGSSPRLVLVTSRSQMRGLTAGHGARRITVNHLRSPESVDLISQFVGGNRPAAEHAAVAELVETRGGLPLALRIVGERAQRHLLTSLHDVATDLRDQRNRLDVLHTGHNDDKSLTDVRNSLSWSYRALPAPAAVSFRRLGLHPAGDFDAYAAAAPAETTQLNAADLLDALSDVHLVERRPALRYAFHELVREYARQLAAAEPAAARAAATARVIAYYLHTAEAAAEVVAPYPADQPSSPTPVPGALPPLPDLAAAAAWLDVEQSTLLALGADLAARGRAALTRARAVEGRPTRGEVVNKLGLVFRNLDRFDEALAHQEALTLFEDIGAGDQVAAPGLLSEVSFHSGVTAARFLLGRPAAHEVRS